MNDARGAAARSQDARNRRPIVAQATGIVRIYRSPSEPVMALGGVDISIRKGEFVAITGPSGSGKSTLLHVLGGLDRPDEGEVMIEGRQLSSLDDKALSLVRRRRIGYVLQFFNLFPTLSALENVAFPLLLDGIDGAVDRARSRLEAVGLGARAAHRPAQLSGGEQQRVALARAMVTEPAIVAADEPTGNLDSKTSAAILGLLRAAADDGQAVVLVTHDQRAADAADRTVRLVDGIVARDDGSARA